MTKKYKIKAGSIDQNLKTKFMELLTSSKNCDKKYKESTDSKFVTKNDRRYLNLKNDKNKNIIVG